MTVDVYGSYFDDVRRGASGDFFVAGGGSGWDPMVFGQASGYGTFEGMTVFENFVRYTYSSSTGSQGYQWRTPSAPGPNVQDPPSAVPEPGSMLLLGTGLLTLAGAARRRLGRVRA